MNAPLKKHTPSMEPVAPEELLQVSAVVEFLMVLFIPDTTNRPAPYAASNRLFVFPVVVLAVHALGIGTGGADDDGPRISGDAPRPIIL